MLEDKKKKMDVRELEKALKHKLGPYVRFIGIYASGRIPFIQHSAKPVLLIANTLKSGTDINTVTPQVKGMNSPWPWHLLPNPLHCQLLR